MPAISKRDQILAALSAFIRQRPGLEYGNYGDATAYRSEVRSITRDLHDAQELLAAVSWRQGIDETALRYAIANAYSGRLTLQDTAAGGVSLDYCTGQYFPTEYRKAVCAVLSSALWSYFRDGCNAKTGDEIRKMARRELSRRVASRWFN